MPLLGARGWAMGIRRDASMASGGLGGGWQRSAATPSLSAGDVHRGMAGQPVDTIAEPVAKSGPG